MCEGQEEGAEGKLLFFLSPIYNCCHISGHLLGSARPRHPRRLHRLGRHRPSDILMIFRVRIFCVCNFPALNCFYVLALLYLAFLLFSIIYNFIYFLVAS